MAKISEFYLEKSEAERKLKVLEMIIECEKLLESNNVSLVCGKACIGSEKLGSVMSELKLFPDACNEFHQDVLKAVRKYMEEIKKIEVDVGG